MSVSSTGEKTLEARTLRKVIIRAVPFLMALYFVNYLDRTNLGIAKADISEHLQLTASMFGLASGIFFIGYVLVEVPSNLALERFGARRWLARIAVSWGNRRRGNRIRTQRTDAAGVAVPARRGRGRAFPGRDLFT